VAAARTLSLSSEYLMRLPAALFLSLFVVSSSHAQNTMSTQDAMTQVATEVAKCVDVADPGERLKCFDKAASLAKSALASAPTVAAEKKSWLDWFGFSKSPAPPKTAEEYGKGAPPPAPGEVTQITSTVLEFAKTSRGEAVFILENGQIWRQLQGDNTVFREPLPSPMKVTIENGFLGSYNLTVDGRNAMMKVMRLK
jgi:hypothetical protein